MKHSIIFIWLLTFILSGCGGGGGGAADLPSTTPDKGSTTTTPDDGSTATTPDSKGSGTKSDTVDLSILAINDFHGNIATTSSGSGRADYLATNIQSVKEGVTHSILVSAGDMVGASPLVSSMFHDEPTIEALNQMGLELSAVGNHELDEGINELKRIENGGSHPDGDLDGDSFSGANFKFLASNIVNSANDRLFPAYAIKTYDDIDVAFIGVTLESAPKVVAPSAITGITFQDEITSINSLIPSLQNQGIEAFVILLHEGGQSNGGFNDCGSGLNGPVVDIANGVNDAVDIIITGHSHDAFICEVDGKTVTMAGSNGMMFTDIKVSLNRTTKDLTVISATNKKNTQSGVVANPAVTQLIKKYSDISDAKSKQVVGHVNTSITRYTNSAGESALGDIITDAQLAATSAADKGNAQIAFTANGGIRSNLYYTSGGSEADGEVTFEEAFATQPFANNLVTMTLTGQQIHDILERQFTDTRILQVSNGVTYEWSYSAADGNKVEPNSIKLNGVTLSPSTGYRVTVNSFIADGGDNYQILTQGTNRLVSDILDYEALVEHLKTNASVSGSMNRITRLP